MDQSVDSTLKHAGQIIENRRREIERRWLDTVQCDIVNKPDVELTQLRDGIPDYLEELAKTLTDGTGSINQQGESAWAKVAKHHGITRVRIGFDISQLVHEFSVLRRVLYEVVQEEEPAFAHAQYVLAELLDAAISAAVQSYVDARDYDARRAQAENIGFLTHELRQPLSTAVVASAGLRPKVPSDALPLVNGLEKALRRLQELIDGVLLAEKLTAGEADVQPTELQLRQLMEPLESMKRTAEEKGLRFSVSYDPELTVILDPTLTRSVIQNLAENAVKYTDVGEINISVSNTDDELILDVRDTCQGLSPEELRTIFEPFKRGHTQKTGTGLGLAIARRAVEAQGGSIEAESPGPSGCHFSVRLPRKPSPDLR